MSSQVLRRIVMLLALTTLTSCEELSVGCVLVELVVPDHHYDDSEKYEGKITDFEKWWGQFDGTPLGKLLELAIKNSPLLDVARNRLRETAYKYGMKEESVESMLSNLDEYFHISILPPNSHKAEDTTFSATHVATGDIPKDFVQGDKNYFRLFRFQIEVDLFGKNKSWREAAVSDILSVIDIVKDTFSLMRSLIAKDFVTIRGQQVRQHHLQYINCDCQTVLKKLHERIKLGIDDDKSLNQAQRVLDEADAKIFHLGEGVKKAFYSLLANTGINNLEELQRIVGTAVELPNIDQNVFAGTPIEVIKNRPDVKSKLNIFRNVCGLMGMSLADKFPKVIIETVFESAAKSIFQILNIDNYSFAYGYHIEQNFFEQEKVKANVNKNKSLYKKAQSDYKSIASRALAEVAQIMTDKAITERQIKLVDQKLSLLDKKIGKVEAKAKESAEHLAASLNVTNEKFQAVDKKLELEVNEFISTINLVRSLGG